MRERESEREPSKTVGCHSQIFKFSGKCGNNFESDVKPTNSVQKICNLCRLENMQDYLYCETERFGYAIQSVQRLFCHLCSILFSNRIFALYVCEIACNSKIYPLWITNRIYGDLSWIKWCTEIINVQYVVGMCGSNEYKDECKCKPYNHFSQLKTDWWMFTSTNFANDIGLRLIDSYGMNQFDNKLKSSTNIRYFDEKRWFFLLLLLHLYDGMQIVSENILTTNAEVSFSIMGPTVTYRIPYDFAVAKSFTLRLIFDYEFIECN